MTEAPTLDPKVISTATRLTREAKRTVSVCAHPAGKVMVGIVRGFDSDSYHLAREVRTRLSRAGIGVVDIPAPLLGTRVDLTSAPHLCAYVEANGVGVEADRIAATTHTPLVRLATDDEDRDKSSQLAAMHATWLQDDPDARRTFPSAFGSVPELAFDTFLIAPNQPETGELAIRAARPVPRELPPGSSVSIRCLPEALIVEAIDSHGPATTWLASSVEITQQAGLHCVFRDGLPVADLDPAVRIDHDPGSLRLHIV